MKITASAIRTITRARSVAYDAATALVGGAINLISPGLAARYRYGRESYRTYVAGETSGPNKEFAPRTRSADADIKKGGRLITARARDQIQNNPYISGGIEKICNNVVRKGIRPQFCLRTGKEIATAKNNKLEALWGSWATNPDVSCDDSMASLQKLWLRHHWSDGEILIHRVWDDSVPGVVPLRLETIECDHLDRRVDGRLDNGNIGRGGIEYDPVTGRKVAFHVLNQHPGDSMYLGTMGESRRLLATDVIHSFDRRRASQTTGVSWLASIIMEAYDLAEFRSSTRVTARLATAFAVFVKSTYPDMGPGVVSLAGSSSDQPELPSYVEPGSIIGLPRNTDITTASPNVPGDQYEPFVRDSVRGMSTGVGMSFEAYSNDYSSASYSSARSASLEERLSYSGQQLFLSEKILDRILCWFLEAAVVAGLAPSMPGYGRDPRPYNLAHTWQVPGWGWVDPLKDSKAAVAGIEHATTSRTRTTQKQGEDWQEIVAELVIEEEQLLELNKLRAQNKGLLEPKIIGATP